MTVNEGLDLLKQIGFVLDPWQVDSFKASLTEDEFRRWVAKELGVIVSRQNGKGSIVEAREIVGLYLLRDQIMHTAHEFKTAIEGFARLDGWFTNIDSLRKCVKRVSRSHGEEGIELRNGARIKFVARTSGSGRGFTADTMVLDEAYKLPATVMGALLPTLSARPNPQIIYTSTAGMIDSDQLRSVRARAVAGNDPFLWYFEWSASQNDPDDREMWAEANPALGFRITEESIARERAAMPPAEFGRERLGIWDEAAGVVERVVPFAQWMACFVPKARPVSGLRFAVEVAQRRESATIAVAGDLDGMPVVQIVEQAGGTGWVVDRLIELLAKWPKSELVLDPRSPAGGLIPDLEMRGVPFVEMATKEFVAWTGDFIDLAMQGKLRHSGQPPLDAALNVAVLRPLGDAKVWDRKKSVGDISPLVAATIALGAHRQVELVPARVRVINMSDFWERV